MRLTVPSTICPTSAGTTARRGVLAALFSQWTWRMAWRDSRASRRRLLFFSCSIVLGIAALTAIGSLGTNLERAIEEQAKGLLGADLVIASRQSFGPEEEQLFHEIGGEQSREISFPAMIYFLSPEGTRLVQVTAVDGHRTASVRVTPPPSVGDPNQAEAAGGATGGVES